jgi:hypothetical protein
VISFYNGRRLVYTHKSAQHLFFLSLFKFPRVYIHTHTTHVLVCSYYSLLLYYSASGLAPFVVGSIIITILLPAI